MADTPDECRRPYCSAANGKRTITQYTGIALAFEEDLREQVTRHKEVEENIKQLKAEQRYIEKELAL